MQQHFISTYFTLKKPCKTSKNVKLLQTHFNATLIICYYLNGNEQQPRCCIFLICWNEQLLTKGHVVTMCLSLS